MNTIESSKIIENLAVQLKKTIKQPEWTPYVKTSTHKERPPTDKEWFFKRAASVLLQISKKGPIGVAKLRVKYGGRKNMGVGQEKFYKGSGNIIRKALQELDKAGLTIQAEKNVHKGRVLTPKGQSLISKCNR
ncbi:TPA: 40S ribosomal protein S19 [Candidatus Woesearchaeota archaeon]|nr:40S ribosomal protein S19 [Candidatus Woesearchaeota archaeon]HIH31140.1 40S ribosomal protein S19 [Candidatus Woesearchaeota archaeon]HIH54621.1 40S ribosomal protein S19 [Candidatus Woesearchaeota archaeon]HIJ02325.1 40S ribosomal protein S19 [Candidatus Woesearchaeota archaeon]HIJ14197.1 40S ribosomal protein S19 [Candidatus Woesearchaeota archaeon]